MGTEVYAAFAGGGLLPLLTFSFSVLEFAVFSFSLSDDFSGGAASEFSLFALLAPAVELVGNFSPWVSELVGVTDTLFWIEVGELLWADFVGHGRDGCSSSSKETLERLRLIGF